MNFLAPFRAAPTARASSPVGFYAHPDLEMVQLNHYGDALRVRDLYEGVQIFGATGSGKSSGSAKEIALAMLSAGWGGLVLCAKPDEADRWEKYARATGRTAHIVRMTPQGPFNFNFVDYEIHRPDGGGGQTYNLVVLMELVMDALARTLGTSGNSESSPFWPLSKREKLTNVIEPLVAATGQFRLADAMRMVISAPKSREEAFSDAWKANSYCYHILRKAYDNPAGAPLPIHAHQASADYWFGTFAGLDSRTRSNIVATLTSAISPFLRGILHDRFCTNTNVIPEMSQQGVVFLLDFPVKVWGALAVVAAHIFKYEWQRAMERRRVGPYTRPTFLFADECQFYLSEYDAEFQSTARSSCTATVYITQNLPTYYAQLPGRDPRATADSLLGNFQTKIYHANTDPTTNQHAADAIGKSIQRRRSGNWSSSNTAQSSETNSSNWGRQRGRSTGESWGRNSSIGSSADNQGHFSVNGSHGRNSGGQEGQNWSRSDGGGYSYGDSVSLGQTAGGGWTEQVDYTVQPAEFAACLRKGGAADGGLVDGIIVQGGRRFAATKAHWLPCTFRQ
ncbi:MAG TPA: TraM recognition domain-containing protein [Rhizomicrobium sp.]